MHWLAYLSWPLAFMHSLSAGGDMKIWWVAALVWGSASAVAVAIGIRLVLATRGDKKTWVNPNRRPEAMHTTAVQIGST
jgi:hypothetical protein